jgi:hypothetical protein
MNARIVIPVLVIVCVAIIFAGCTGTQSATTPGTSTQMSGTSTTSGSIVPGPTETLPPDYYVVVDVGEKDYLGKIPVTFEGGTGQVFVKKIDVTLTRSDGTVQTATVGANKGDIAQLEGTKQTDRVEVWVSMVNGVTYKIIDVQSPYRTRG